LTKHPQRLLVMITQLRLLVQFLSTSAMVF
jgi:hypothetical protein